MRVMHDVQNINEHRKSIVTQNKLPQKWCQVHKHWQILQELGTVYGWLSIITNWPLYCIYYQRNYSYRTSPFAPRMTVPIPGHTDGWIQWIHFLSMEYGSSMQNTKIDLNPTLIMGWSYVETIVWRHLNTVTYDPCGDTYI